MKTFIFSKYTFLLFVILLGMSVNSCKKQNDFLSAVPDEALTIPKNLNDLQLILQNDRVFNNCDPDLGLVNCEDYYLTDANFLSMPSEAKNEYIWAKDPYPNTYVADWSKPYTAVWYANVVLDNLSKFSSQDPQRANTIKGTALFFRSWAFFNLLQTFSLPYDSNTSSKDLGIPLRLSSDFNKKYQRSTVQECINQIIQDVRTSVPLLPTTAINNALPTKTAANAFLARIYLATADYINALQFANACLAVNNAITDFNTLNLTKRPIASSLLTEEIFRATALNLDANATSQIRVDPTFYSMYDPNDLRKKIFFFTFLGRTYPFGSYDIQNNQKFTGLATDEIYLIRAECYARQGNTSAALNDLNGLLSKRWLTGTFTSYTAADATDALKKILSERRKELIFRGLRWIDLRRLNKDLQFATTLTRTVNGQTYTLLPNDARYAMPIPDDEIRLSGIPQNQR